MKRIRIGHPDELLEIELVGEDGRTYVLRNAFARKATLELRDKPFAGGELEVRFVFEHAEAEPEQAPSKGPRRPASSRRADTWPEDMNAQGFKARDVPPRVTMDDFRRAASGIEEEMRRAQEAARHGARGFSSFAEFLRGMGFSEVDIGPPPPRPRARRSDPYEAPRPRDEEAPRARHQPMKSWREVLENPADLREAETAYKRLAKTRHPDHGGTHDAMVELNRAMDEARRYWK